MIQDTQELREQQSEFENSNVQEVIAEKFP